jgi:hypothetical protein
LAYVPNDYYVVAHTDEHVIASDLQQLLAALAGGILLRPMHTTPQTPAAEQPVTA